ncbi:DUF7146 domain-containing protein [Methylocystis parvus]|uniref:DUF7146 domain-containing protein n=1 Tax=Methylocystis parvus TaxID=134 RepID=UPI003C72A2CF
MSADRDAAWREWIEEARRVKVAAFCATRGIRLRPGDAGQPCPACGGRDRFAVNIRKNVWNCRVSGEKGDAIALARHMDGTDFVAACEEVTGRPPPGRDSSETAEARAEREARLVRLEEERIAEEARQMRVQADYREAERRRAWGFWARALPIGGTPAEAYLEKRRIRPHPTSRLRYAPEMELWNESKSCVARRGPALLAAIEGVDGRFTGVHVTWIDLGTEKGKAETIDPETGTPLPAKKVRGSIKGGSIRLVSAPGNAPRRWFLGEGIETVLSVYWALVEAGSPLVEGAEFRTGVDLDNLCGKAAGRVKHPTKTFTDARGRVRAVRVRDDAPVAPEGDWKVIYIPPSVEELILLGDGDSDPFTTRLGLLRGAKRFSREYPALTVKLAMSREGVDFSDMRMEAAAA